MISIVKAVVLLSLFLLLACNGAGPCVANCKEYEAFWEACHETFQEDYHVSVACYEDVEELGEALAEAGNDDEARDTVYDEWDESGRTYDCEDADEIVEQCIDITRAKFSALDAEGREDLRQECIEGDENSEEIDQAVEAEDCGGFLRAIGVVE